MAHRRRAVLLLGAILALVASFGARTKGAAANETYTIIDLGTLGGSGSRALGINDAGQVVGGAILAGDTAEHAFRWSDADNDNVSDPGEMVDLGSLDDSSSVAIGINAAGQVAGFSGLRAFRWSDVDKDNVSDPDEMVDLGTLGGSHSLGSWGINAAGQVAGAAGLTNDTTSHAFRWSDTDNNNVSDPGEMVDLGTLGGSHSQALDMNDAGQVVGVADLTAVDLTGDTTEHAFRWSDADNDNVSDPGEMVDLGTLGGTDSEASGINDAGQVVGGSNLTGDTARHAFRWSDVDSDGRSDPGEMVDLGTLGGSSSRAIGINAAGQVVGVANLTGDTTEHAFRWSDADNDNVSDPGEMVDLNSLLPAGSGWELSSAYGINVEGQIVGAGWINGQEHGFLLSPPNINDAPVAVGQSVTTAEDTSTVITLGASDPDGDSLTYSVVTQPAQGTLSGTAPNLTYTPAANFNGSDSFTFQANDGTLDSNVATVTITVDPVNDGPTAANDAATTKHNTATTIPVLNNDSDVDGNRLSVASVSQGSQGGKVVINANGTVTYTPKRGFRGTDSFTYKANDGLVDSNMATVTVTVTR